MTRLLLDAMADIRSVALLDLPQWNRLLLQARYHGLLARLAEELDAAGLAAPAGAHRQLAAAQGTARANQVALRFEIGRVQAALCESGFPVALLKGGAYVAADLSVARGRSAVDLDILVPRERLSDAERALQAAGWRVKDTDEYDDHYYREWMHELPPFEHPDREMSLDVHHTIFPPISGVRISGAALLEAARPIGGGLFILQPADLVLHAALHLFGEDTNNRVRDLVDLRDLVRGATDGREAGWDELLDRARTFNVLWALDHALEHLARLLQVPVPEAVRAAVAAGRRPWSPLTSRVLTASLLGRVPGESGRWTKTAQRLAYIRSHWLRMPPLLLARHLWIKAKRRREEGKAA